MASLGVLVKGMWEACAAIFQINTHDNLLWHSTSFDDQDVPQQMSKSCFQPTPLFSVFRSTSTDGTRCHLQANPLGTALPRVDRFKLFDHFSIADVCPAFLWLPRHKRHLPFSLFHKLLQKRKRQYRSDDKTNVERFVFQ